MMTTELDALRKTLRQEFTMHLSLQGGGIMGYQIVDGNGRRVGSKSIHTMRANKKSPTKTAIVYTMGDREFSTIEEFLLAYRQKLRDEEFEAAKPKEKTT